MSSIIMVNFLCLSVHVKYVFSAVKEFLVYIVQSISVCTCTRGFTNCKAKFHINNRMIVPLVQRRRRYMQSGVASIFLT